MALRGDRSALPYANALVAPPEVQDAVMMSELTRRWEDPRFQRDPERLIAAHFQGEAPIVFGPKDRWNVKPTNQEGETTLYNPEIGKYVASIMTHIDALG